jgi:hypothetical protein
MHVLAMHDSLGVVWWHGGSSAGAGRAVTHMPPPAAIQIQTLAGELFTW